MSLIKTTPNYRRVVLRLTEDALRNFGGLDCDRETAATLLAVWPCRALLDEELTAEVLSRFPAELVPVAGKDWLPQADWSKYAACPTCDVAAGLVCVFSNILNMLGEPRTTPHERRPLVEVTAQPTAEAVHCGFRVCDQAAAEGDEYCALHRNEHDSAMRGARAWDRAMGS